MATALPPTTDFTGASVTEAQFKTALTSLRGYLAAGLGTEGTRSPASMINRLIGGDFTVNPWTRGTTFTGPASADYTADRWAVVHSSDAVVDILKTADAPTAAQAGLYTAHCLHADVTTADASIAAGQYYTITQRVEGLNAASLGFGQGGTRYVTVSFWVKSTITGTYGLSLLNSANNRCYVTTYTVSSADTWEYKTATIPVDTTGTWLYDTGVGLRLRFCLAAGSTYQTTAGAWAAGDYMTTSAQANALSSTANNFKLALVQLEAGETAGPFQARDVGTELILCRRYLPAFVSTGTADYFTAAGSVASSTSCKVNYVFEVTPRVAPTGITVSSAGHFSVNEAGVLTACNSVTFNAATLRVGRVNFDVASGLTAGRAADVLANSASGRIYFTGAEL
jgi:hypothetical protein